MSSTLFPGTDEELTVDELDVRAWSMNFASGARWLIFYDEKLNRWYGLKLARVVWAPTIEKLVGTITVN
jgi:hypothetical protein